ncbi:MAG TPA: protein kinase [Gemmatimonadales bacterium]|nr:protein kinase [Gemmatimonadales bacterium]
MTDVTASALADALRDRYRLERELGRGGMATVYLAHDLKHDRPVALKVLHPKLAATVGPDRFLREIRIAARLQHPHILPLHDSGEGAGQLWYTMPYVDGESLRDRLRRERQLPLDVALGIARQIAGALDYAHQHGVIHRDMKPENVLLSGDQVLVADFGIAKALDAAGEQTLTETGLSLGTPAYMSPEQATASPVDRRSDIYSLGCIVYEMLTGDPPFAGASPRAIMARHAVDPVPAIRTARPGVPSHLEQAINRSLAKVPADRFPTASEFGAALELREDAGHARTPPSGLPAVARRSRLLFASGAIALAALVASALTLLRTRVPATVDPNLLAVAPFDVLDPSLELWREGLVDVLSRDLDGAGPVRTVSQSVALKHWAGRADPTSAAALGERTRAGLVVFGTLARTGADSVSLRATVLDRSRNEAEPDLEVAGGERRIGELADSLGVRILRVLGRGRPIGSVRHVSLASRSLPALKEFLRGEQFYRRGLWDSALVHYDRAVAQDSTFGLALRRMVFVLGWGPATSGEYRDQEEYRQRSVKLNHGLSPRDSLLFLADSLNNLSHPSELFSDHHQAVAVLEEAARRYPSDPEIWYTLGEYRHHDEPPIRDYPAALDAFERAIRLDSGFAPAYEHVVQLEIQRGRPDLALRYARAYPASDSTDVNAPSLRLVALVLDTGGVGAPAATRAIRSASAVALFRAGLEHLGSWPDSAETAIALLRELATGRHEVTGADPWVADSVMWPQYLAATLAFRGHLRAAAEADRRLLTHPEASPFSGFQDPFLSLSLLGVIPDSVAGATFRRSLEPGAPWEPFTPRHLRGLPWWLAKRDTASLAKFTARAAAVATRGKSPPVARRARLLGALAGAYLMLARYDSAAALLRLESIPDTLCSAGAFSSSCFYGKLTLARLLAARGEYRPAGDLLERWWSLGDGPFCVLAMLERGRITERLGERQKAVESYRYVADAWRRADPELQPYATEAREALARLTRE